MKSININKNKLTFVYSILTTKTNTNDDVFFFERNIKKKKEKKGELQSIKIENRFYKKKFLSITHKDEKKGKLLHI